MQSISKSADVHRSHPLAANSIKKDSEDTEIQIAYGLVQILNPWVRAQLMAEASLLTGLTVQQKAFLRDNLRKYGCALPPATSLTPDLASFTFKPAITDSTQLDKIDKCLKILQASSYSWSYQSKSSNSQHHSGIAVGLLCLLKDASIYKQYLGEQTIWQTFKAILAVIRQFSPMFLPWHGIVDETDRKDNDKQVIITESFEGSLIGPVVGAGMADQVSSINQKYHIGIQKIWAVVAEMASYENEGQKYLADDIKTQTENLFLVSNFYSDLITIN